MDSLFARLGALSAFLAVAAGAFGAHGLRSILSEESLQTFDVAVRYQMYHALALFISAWLYYRLPTRWAIASGWLFTAGSLLFCGSLYLLVLTGEKWWGPITPLGGLAFMLGWLCLLPAARTQSE